MFASTCTFEYETPGERLNALFDELFRIVTFFHDSPCVSLSRIE
jgi:hypothetical protein